MNKTEALAEVFVLALKSLAKSERTAVLVGVAQAKSLKRDLYDVLTIGERRTEPSRSFRNYLTQRNSG